MISQNKLILDADGVFLDERPYWNVALATALCMNGLSAAARGQWERLAGFAFGSLGLQRVTKGRGCNSNWDLAAVLAEALGDDRVRNTVKTELEANRPEDAGTALSQGADALWQGRDDTMVPNDSRDGSRDPLCGFGLERRSERFTEVVDRYQCVLRNQEDIDWPFERTKLKEHHDAVCGAFDRCIKLGYGLRVCTGRHGKEVNGPIELLGLSRYLPPDSVTSGDEVDRAEALTCKHPLAKPHWFAPACAAVGFDQAVACLGDEPMPARNGDIVYIGDAIADFRAVTACRRIGLSIRYVHIRSGVTTPSQETAIRDEPATLDVIDRLDEVPALLGSPLP